MKLLTCIWKVIGSNFGRNTDGYYWEVSWFYAALPGNCQRLQLQRCSVLHNENTKITNQYTRGADKSFARPGRKKVTATKLELSQTTQKKKIQKVVRPTRSPRQELPPRRTKNGDLSIVFQSGRAKELSAPFYILKIKLERIKSAGHVACRMKTSARISLVKSEGKNRVKKGRRRWQGKIKVCF